MYEKLLPIGSVILLKGANKRLMICGRIQTRAGERKVYDYSACPYPEGIVDPAKMLFFDHGAIAHLFFVGFQDEEELRYRLERLGSLGELEVDEDGVIREVEMETDEKDAACPVEEGGAHGA